MSLCSREMLTDGSTFTVLNHLVIWGTLAAYFIVMSFGNAFVLFGFYHSMFHLFWDPSFWFCVMVTSVGAMVPIVAAKVIAKQYFPAKRTVCRRTPLSSFL